MSTGWPLKVGPNFWSFPQEMELTSKLQSYSYGAQTFKSKNDSFGDCIFMKLATPLGHIRMKQADKKKGPTVCIFPHFYRTKVDDI